MTAPAEGARDGAFMRIALGHALAAGEAGEVPVGAVLVCGEDRYSHNRLVTTTTRGHRFPSR